MAVFYTYCYLAGFLGVSAGFSLKTAGFRATSAGFSRKTAELSDNSAGFTMAHSLKNNKPPSTLQSTQ